MTVARSLARRVIVACVVCMLLGAGAVLAVALTAGGRVATRVAADTMRGLIAGAPGALCRAAPEGWTWRGPDGTEAGFYDRETLRAARADAPPVPDAVKEMLADGKTSLGRLFVPPGGGLFAAVVADAGPCSLYVARWPPIPGARPWALVALLTALVVAGALAMLVALRWITRPTFGRLQRLADSALAVGEARPEEDREPDEIGVVANALGRAHDRLVEEREARVRRTRVLEEHLSDLAHDVKTPLTSIFMALEDLLEDGDTPPDIRARAAETLADAQYLASLIENRHLDAQLSTGLGDGATRAALDWGEIARRVAARYRRVAAGRAVTIRVEGDAGDAWQGVPALAEQALSNLVQNAVIHGGAEVRVTVGTEALTVADDGPGVPPEELTRLGTRHYRGDRARQRAPYGSGLGLAIVRSVCAVHGWAMEVASEGGLRVTMRRR